MFRERLAARGMLHQAEQFFRCSGALAAACYKEEIEAAMRSQYVAGFQLLDLQDFSGQGTALVGMLDAFMESKGLISPEEWRMFCSNCVLLAQFPSYVCITGEMLAAKVSLRCATPAFPEHNIIEWLLVAENGETLGEGNFTLAKAEVGLNEVGSIFCRMPEEVQRPMRMHLVLSVRDTDVCNAYDLMLYPAIAMPELADHGTLCVTEKLDKALQTLETAVLCCSCPRKRRRRLRAFTVRISGAIPCFGTSATG